MGKLFWAYFDDHRLYGRSRRGRDNWFLYEDRGTVDRWVGWGITRGRHKYSVKYDDRLHDRTAAAIKTFRSLAEAKAFAEVCYRVGVQQ